MKLDVPLHDVSAAADDARALAEVGVSGAFTFEGPNDVFVPLARAAGAAEIDLYSNIAVSFPRSPVHLAHTAWELARLNHGRFLLGLGSQVRSHVERRYGAAFAHPARRMADQVDAVHAVFDSWQEGAPLAHRGEFWQLDLMPPLFRPPPLDTGPPPVLVAAVGPRMTRVAVEHADGILLHPFTTDAYVASVSGPQLANAAAGFVVVGGAIVAMADNPDDQERADDAARALVAFYGSTPAYRPVLDSVDHGELQPELRTLTAANRWSEMAALVDDSALASIVVRGDPASVATGLHRRYGPLASRVAVTLPHPPPLRLLGQLAQALDGTG